MINMNLHAKQLLYNFRANPSILQCFSQDGINRNPDLKSYSLSVFLNMLINCSKRLTMNLSGTAAFLL